MQGCRRGQHNDAAGCGQYAFRQTTDFLCAHKQLHCRLDDGSPCYSPRRHSAVQIGAQNALGACHTALRSPFHGASRGQLQFDRACAFAPHKKIPCFQFTSPLTTLASRHHASQHRSRSACCMRRQVRAAGADLHGHGRLGDRNRPKIPRRWKQTTRL